MRQSLYFAVLAGFVALTGCGDGMTRIEGTVKLDGQPLADGTITFVPADGQTASAGGPIKNGVYSVEAPPGSKKVEIQASKVVGERPAYAGDPNSPKIPITESIIPARYNTETTLTADLKPGTNDGVNFDLQSQ